jgi:hypothetical protein
MFPAVLYMSMNDRTGKEGEEGYADMLHVAHIHSMPQMEPQEIS